MSIHGPKYYWSESWSPPFEGPLTRLAKLAQANGFNSKRLNYELFGLGNAIGSGVKKHGRSLVDMGWTSCARRQLTGFTKSLIASSLYGKIGRNSLLIASDEKIKICRACFECGFLPSIFQIDAILLCPIHSDRLESCCPKCGQQLGKYAISSEVFDSLFSCQKCGAIMSEAWTVNGMVKAWSAKIQHDALSRIDTWLRLINRCTWPQGDSNLVARANSQEEKLIEFNILCWMHPFPKLSASPIHKGTLKILSYESQRRAEIKNPLVLMNADRMQIYKSIRRHASKRWEIRKLARIAFKKNGNRFHWISSTLNGFIFPNDLHCGSPESFGFLRWRFRFERFIDIRDPFKFLHAKSSLSFRLDTWGLPPAHLSTNSWAAIAFESLLQDMITANEIWRQLSATNSESYTSWKIKGGSDLFLQYFDLNTRSGMLAHGVGEIALDRARSEFWVASTGVRPAFGG